MPTSTFELVCGPLLNYRYLSDPDTKPVWHGSVLIVGRTNLTPPPLLLRPSPHGLVLHDDAVRQNSARSTDSTKNDNRQGSLGLGQGQARTGSASQDAPRQCTALRLYADAEKTFWRFDLAVPLTEREARWEYTVNVAEAQSRTDKSNDQQDGTKARQTSDSSDSGLERSLRHTFVVPARDQSMRIMFHSCNGFSVGTDEDAWSGPALWHDVLRMHAQKPFHVMIGGGDQIYNDGVRVDGPLAKWTAIGNPVRRREYPFTGTLRDECDDYYFANYVRWYMTEPFRAANAQIAQINIWDDHDIIDGFGSYTDHFMRCAVFRGIGSVSFKYYSLFQHHIPPPRSTFTSDNPAGFGVDDPRQLEETYTLTGTAPEPCYIIGKEPGPYVLDHSRSMFARLSGNMAFVGIDARLERTRHQINYPDTYNLIFERLEAELTAARGRIRHLLLLLGVPIAYPRLVWLENLFQSPFIAPLRLLNRRFGLAGGLFNKFDGQVDLLDDLDDHYTAKHHKAERKKLILRLQQLAATHGVRVTILGGDVHLAAIGRFYANPRRRIASENDPRFMVNIISSAITNKPPPAAIANLLARRNKIHHLDRATDETLMPFFDRDPRPAVHNGLQALSRTADFNHVTMPSRNYAIITEAKELAAASANELQERDTNEQSNGTANGLPNGAANLTANENANVNGHANGYANGNANGYANGHANGLTNGHANGSANGAAKSSANGYANGPNKTANGAITDLPNGAANGTADHGKTVAATDANGTNLPASPGSKATTSGSITRKEPGRGHDGHQPLHLGEDGAGTKHIAASGVHSGVIPGGLDVSIRVEINQHDPQGRTEGYGFSIPPLNTPYTFEP